ncbi:MAG: cytochrome C [Nitrospirae bacterium]|nr:cytochrome C [Nitrospirota bacterium]
MSMRVAGMFLVTILLLLPVAVFAVPEVHLDQAKLPNGCSSCHKAHGRRGTAMLSMDKNNLCFSCHGAVKTGRPGEAANDVQTVFDKIYRHPVSTTAMYHSYNETLPEHDPTKDRHVICDDCHNVHRTTSYDAMRMVSGYTSDRVNIKRAVFEYEVCYKCHSDSANLPANSKNMRLEFSSANPSYHPVETIGRSSNVPSLVAGYGPNSMIKCTDCHGNDDPVGAKGPHGSNNPNMLVGSYTLSDGPETPVAYELCYRCHDRTSILSNASFLKHKEHVEGGTYTGHTPVPASCFTCHGSHGSTLYPRLIAFNLSVVMPNQSGLLTYLANTPGRPRCNLTCHDYEHWVDVNNFQNIRNVQDMTNFVITSY